MIDLSRTDGVNGSVAAGFEGVADAMAALAAESSDYSAQFCAYHRGVPVVDIWAGSDAGPDRIHGVFSVTKGMAGACIAILVDRGLIDLDAPVGRYWPEFAQSGKAAITVRSALSHQAGVVGVDPQVSLAVTLDHDEMARLVARQMPFWRPGAGMGYHALTIGTIMDELIRRVTGATAAEFFRDQVAGPRAIDAYIAVPDVMESRVDPVLPVRTMDAQPAEVPQQPFVEPASLTGVAFNAARFDPFDPPLANLRAARAAGHAAVGGAASARGLARLYAAITEDIDGRGPLVSSATVAEMSQLQVAAVDLVLGLPARYAVVWQKADERLAYGSHRAFGHDGAGGAFGVADPEFRLAVGYVPSRLTEPGGADPRGLALAAAARRAVIAG
ncbi:serine hydrolase domain-containing protein [Microbacterium sp. SSM24]|uniref:serine hydrolase domain-containing protein n=1 Tax=Microbacterium sp. SSM24 TaxID=2991714 RepID=UPI002226BCB4|nr:serine hydrolase domain-containing protein [Microbacterium sp. SSM24]MCW3492685.1 beta-lactamase family protein [Microbacterium sp. SSM24]